MGKNSLKFITLEIITDQPIKDLRKKEMWNRFIPFGVVQQVQAQVGQPPAKNRR